MIRIVITFLCLLLLLHRTALAQQETVTLYIPDAYAYVGDTLTIDIRVSGFTDIISFQSSINWNADLLTFIKVYDFGISDFGTNFGTTNASQGHIRFLWESLNSVALTVEDGTALFSAQFVVTADNYTTTRVTFVDVTSSPAYPTEFADGNFEVLPVTTLEATIELINERSELVRIQSTPNRSCDEKTPDGSLKANVHGDSINYSFHWYNGEAISSTPDFIGYNYTNIAPGTYTLQVYDENNVLFVESIQSAVNDESPQNTDVLSIVAVAPQTSCSTSPEDWTGALEIQINDAQEMGTHQITWWRNSYEQEQELEAFRDAYRAEHLPAGTYEIAVINLSTGCVRYLTGEVADAKVLLEASTTSMGNNFCADGANGSASITLTNSGELDPRYYWFFEGDEIDTAFARHKGAEYTNITHGNYTALAIDLISFCSVSTPVGVAKNEIYPEASITQKGDTLFATIEQASWYRNDTLIQLQSAFLIPEKSGSYTIITTNEYKCSSESEPFYFGITGLDNIKDEITLYPNPFNEILHISNKNGVIEYVNMYNLKGKLLFEYKDINKKFIDLDVSSLPQGVYFIYIWKERKMLRRKIIKNLSKQDHIH